jgi:hypothetical protein
MAEIVEEEFHGKCIVKLRVPAQYLGVGATEERKETLEGYKKIVKNMAKTGSGAIILPSLTDEDGQHLFDIEVFFPN